MAEDRSKQTLSVYKKDGTKVTSGTLGASTVALTELAAGTVVAAGDYQVAFGDGKTVSKMADVPGFTVPAAPTEPAGTDDGTGTETTSDTTGA